MHRNRYYKEPWCVRTYGNLSWGSEHLGISPVTGRPSSSPVMSSILSRLHSTGHSASFDDFKILSSCSDTGELMIHESLLIYKLNPLSMYRAAQFLSTFYNLLYHVYFCFVLSVLSCYVLSYTLLSFIYLSIL